MWEIRRARIISIILITLILCGGILVCIITHNRASLRLQEELITTSNIIAHSFETSDIKSLQGNDSDLVSPVYLKIKSRLTLIRESKPSFRFVYLIGRRNQSEYTLVVDSEPISSPDYSPPGQAYTEAPPEVEIAFSEGITCITDSYRDRWGKWVTALTPITDKDNGEIIALLAVDIDVAHWNRQLLWELVSPIAITLLLLILVLLFSNIISTAIKEKNRISESDVQIRQSEQLFRSVIENMREMYFRTNLLGEFTLLSPSSQTIYGPESLVDISAINYQSWIRNSENQESIKEQLLTQDEGVKFELDVTTWLNEPKSLSVSAYKVFDVAGVHIGYEGFAYDITESKKNSEEIHRLLKDKEMLLKEVHHRIKNNMNSIASLLSLQSAGVSDPVARGALTEARGRVLSLMTVYDKLYRSKDFHSISLDEYFYDVLTELESSYSNYLLRIKLTKSLQSIVVGSNLSFHLGIILNELVTNSFKYAFNGELQGEIEVILTQKDKDLELIVRDNGKGLPNGFSLSDNSGFGLSLVVMLVEQFGGSISFKSDHGAEFIVRAPISE